MHPERQANRLPPMEHQRFAGPDFRHVPFAGWSGQEDLGRAARLDIPGSFQIFSQQPTQLFGAVQIALYQGDACFRVEASVFGLHHPFGMHQVGGHVAGVLGLLQQSPVTLA
ncbi:MAG TPA: hypothetical protein VGG72_07325 [Bryobacteraceae bacterium]|jgi:hypothetical protein